MPMAIMTVPVTPVGSYGCAGYRANSRTSAAAHDASNDRTAQCRLRKCIRYRYRRSQSQ